MRSDRRTFIKTGALALAGTAISNDLLFAATRRNGIVGLQLYSIRDDMTHDPLGSLEKLAEMGYKYVEHANYADRKFYGFTAPAFRKILDDLGLKMISGHTEMGSQHWDEARKDFSDSWKFTVEDAATLGQKYVISPWINEDIRKSYDNFIHYMDIFNKCGELCRKKGMKFGYHNHDFEFSQKLNNEKVFDIMMRSIDPDLVVMQLDIGNLYGGGAVALDVVSQYHGRFENVHVKDVAKTGGEGQYESTIIGEGVADVRKVLQLIRKTGGAQVIIIEQESYQEKTPMECVRRDLEIMKKWRYY
jgi:sugar phosphate isomerase/epimerase